jgi:hypothetical protein
MLWAYAGMLECVLAINHTAVDNLDSRSETIFLPRVRRYRCSGLDCTQIAITPLFSINMPQYANPRVPAFGQEHALW